MCVGGGGFLTCSLVRQRCMTYFVLDDRASLLCYIPLLVVYIDDSHYQFGIDRPQPALVSFLSEPDQRQDRSLLIGYYNTSYGQMELAAAIRGH